jgi:4-amino-4-deoxy-L-arabinose transferase-like glycosyltransferase
VPLVANDPHYGPAWNYLLAGLMVLFGPSPDLPRLVALFLGTALVVLTYLFARDLAGRWPAAIAAGLLLTSGGHIVINSHTARSNSITPLLTTAALWLIYRAGYYSPTRDGQARFVSADAETVPAR